jgi:hypothetical protein
VFFCGLRLLRALDANLRFKQALAATTGAPGWLDQLVFTEDEAARTAAGGLNQDATAGRTGRADGVAQVVFDVPALEAQLARDG